MVREEARGLNKPGAVPPEVAKAEFHWQDTAGNQRGPSTWASARLQSGETGPDSLVYADGFVDEWKPVRDVPRLAKLVPPPKVPPAPPAPPRRRRAAAAPPRAAGDANATAVQALPAAAAAADATPVKKGWFAKKLGGLNKPGAVPPEVAKAEFHWQDTAGNQRGPSTFRPRRQRRRRPRAAASAAAAPPAMPMPPPSVEAETALVEKDEAAKLLREPSAEALPAAAAAADATPVKKGWFAKKLGGLNKPGAVPPEVAKAEFHWQDTAGNQRGPSTWAEYEAAAVGPGPTASSTPEGFVDEWKPVRDVPRLAKLAAPPPQSRRRRRKAPRAAGDALEGLTEDKAAAAELAEWFKAHGAPLWNAPGVLPPSSGLDSAEALAHLQEDDVLAIPDIKRGHQKMLIKVVKDLQDSKA
ncbi:hypothetical protein JL722_4561 [Aureococcus anophagefferens]|nr:hypothetical protein JL722_4561 [Aureococcus anophagefferens]